ncbi:MAG: DUF4422 domain-containing protein [Lachnospiraceae bacterium]|nr:DUF4422 domain-containing protein [Lachnospiraceae bacterium]
MKEVQIFVCTHKKFDPPSDPIYVPIQVGRAGKADLGYLGDDTGDQISEKNCYYSELTGLYWAAHNCATASIKGSCHYRRYLLNDAGKVYTAPEIEAILTRYDIMTTKTLTLPATYFDGYSENHNRDDLLLAEKVIAQKYPTYLSTYRELVHGNQTYFGNILIAKSELFDAYVNWLFSIFEEMEPQMDFRGYDDYHKRVFGFISEFLLKVYIKVNHLSVHESVVGMIGEKKETKAVKEQLFSFIRSGKLAEGKAYLLEYLKKRPDILMLASDVNGELKLAMQIITTAEHEKEAYGSSILDKGMKDEELLVYFHTLNRVTQNRKLELLTEADRAWMEQTQVSDVAQKISEMLMNE